MPTVWKVMMAILVVCLIASMVIAVVKLVTL
jgi:Na+-transporting NADH:ubiquinone oxidoreductase subunit NqrC